MKKIKETTAYCYECDKYVEYVEKQVKRTISVRGEKITCSLTECYCKQCGERVLVESIEKENEIMLYDLYKKRIGLLTSEEIRNILRKRDMKQKELAAFLSIGEKDITRYLNGSIQSKNIDKMLRLVDDDEAFERMMELFEGKRSRTSTIFDVDFSQYFDIWEKYFSAKFHPYADDTNKGDIYYEQQRCNADA